MPPLGRGILTGLIALGLLTATASAEAAQRYASPGGITTGSCPQAEPCRIDRAINNAEENDQVIVLPGEYDVSTLPALSTTRTLTVHGTDPLNKPRIVSSGSGSAMSLLGGGSSVYDLDISYEGGVAGVALELGPGAVVNETVARSNAGAAIRASAAQIRNTAAFATSGSAIFLEGSGDSTLRGVTAIGSGPSSTGIYLKDETPINASADVRNSIPRGTYGDLGLQADNAASTVSIDIDHSNFRPDQVAKFSVEANDIFNPGSGNQDGNTTVPLFADLGGRDVHQLAGSPTIDAGVTDSTLGGYDFDGEARVQGAAPDIGADEYPTPASSGEGSTSAPGSTPIAGSGQAKKRKRGTLFVAADAVVRRGQAFLRVHCVGPGHCGGKVLLIFRRTVKRHRHGKVRRARIKLLLGKKPFERSEGKRSVVRVPLYRRGKRLLRRSRNHRLKVWMTGGGVRSRSLELRLPHRRHRGSQ